MEGMEWRPFSDLRETDIDYSSMAYSYGYAKKHKNLENAHFTNFTKPGMRKIGIWECLEVRSDEKGEIWFRVMDKPSADTWQEKREFQTHLGTFVSVDKGEFGGSLTTPGGKQIGGNFVAVFDCEDPEWGMVTYAVSSLGHLLSGWTTILAFLDGEDYVQVYDTDGRTDFLQDKKEWENLVMKTWFVQGGKVYMLLSGHINEKETGKSRLCSKILEITGGDVVRITECARIIDKVGNMIMVDDKAYVTADKMLYEIDLNTGEYRMFTMLGHNDKEHLTKAYE